MGFMAAKRRTYIKKITMWTIAHQTEFMAILRKDTGDNIVEGKRQLQVKIIHSAWPDRYHVITEEISLGAANAITCIMTAAEISKEYGVFLMTGDSLWHII